MRRFHHHSRAFTLIEAVVATAIVGLGIVAMMQLFATGTVSNASATELTTGSTLANNLRELTQSLEFFDTTAPAHWGLEAGETKFTANDVDDLDGQSFSPPIDARRTTLTDFTNWTQSIKVQTIDPNQLNNAIPRTVLSPDKRPVSRVIVTVTHHGKTVCTAEWLVTYLN